MDIVQVGNPVLRQKAAPVDPAWIGSDEFKELVANMVETMRKAPGVGLAAPQVGVSLQIFVVEDRPENVDDADEDDPHERQEVKLRTIVNPELTVVGSESVRFYEGCLSLSGFAGVVNRAHEVRITGLDENAEPVDLQWHGWPARILQHEFDHLQGTLYVDHMETRSFSTTDNLVGDSD